MDGLKKITKVMLLLSLATVSVTASQDGNIQQIGLQGQNFLSLVNEINENSYGLDNKQGEGNFLVRVFRTIVKQLLRIFPVGYVKSLLATIIDENFQNQNQNQNPIESLKSFLPKSDNSGGSPDQELKNPVNQLDSSAAVTAVLEQQPEQQSFLPESDKSGKSPDQELKNPVNQLESSSAVVVFSQTEAEQLRSRTSRSVLEQQPEQPFLPESDESGESPDQELKNPVNQLDSSAAVVVFSQTEAEPAAPFPNQRSVLEQQPEQQSFLPESDKSGESPDQKLLVVDENQNSVNQPEYVAIAKKRQDVMPYIVYKGEPSVFWQ